MERDRDGSVWVHERDYGGSPFGLFIRGAFYLIVGLVQFVLYIFRGKK